MKKNRNVYYKARLVVDDKGVLHGISVFNRLLPYSLMDDLNKAMHDVVDTANGRFAWRETYYKFTHNGVRYEQYDLQDPNTPCKGCIFRGKNCEHPHYYNGTKGVCGKPYRKAKEE